MRFMKLIPIFLVTLMISGPLFAQDFPHSNFDFSDQVNDAWDLAARRVSNGKYADFDSLAKAKDIKLDAAAASLQPSIVDELGNSGKYDSNGMLKKLRGTVRGISKAKRGVVAVAGLIVTAVGIKSEAAEVEYRNQTDRFADTNPKANFNNKKWATKEGESAK